MGVRRFLRDFDQSVVPRREHLVRVCEPYLDPNERVRHVFSGVRRLYGSERWVVVVTDASILVVVTSPGTFRWQPLRPRATFRLPRATRIGPRYGRFWYVLNGQRLLIGLKENQDAIAAADAEMGFPPPTER